MKKYCIIILFVLIAVVKNSQVVYASGIGYIEEFDNLEGEKKYLAEKYEDNYYLDIEKTGPLDVVDKTFNNFANVIFSILKGLGKLVCSIFYFAMCLDITDLLGDQVNALQSVLKSSIFNPLFKLAFAGAAVAIIKRLMKQDIAGVMADIGKVVVIVLISVFIVDNSSTALSNMSKITKSVSGEMLVNMNSQMGIAGESEENSSYAAQSAGILWVNLIHKPWISLEFGNTNVSAETIEKFLTTKPGSDSRKELVKEFEDGTFDKNKSYAQIGMMIVYLIPFFVKAALYLIISMINLIFQLIALFFVLAAPIILLLAMLPGYENIIGAWLKKILETQVSILLLTIPMALMIKLNYAFYNFSSKFGWVVGIVLELALEIGLFLGRNKILHAFTNMQRNVGNPKRTQMQLKHMGNPYQGAENIQRQVKVIKTVIKKKNLEKNLKTKSEGRRESNRKVRPRTKTEVPRRENSTLHDYAATPTSYNQIDTSDINTMWENAVPKSQLQEQQSESQDAKGKKTVKKQKVTRPVTYEKDRRIKRNVGINQKPSSTGNRRTVNIPEEKKEKSRPVMNGEPIETRRYPKETQERPIIMNGEPIETRRDPEEAQEKPIILNGEPIETRRYPKEAQERPIILNGEPIETKRYPEEAQERPIILNGEPIETSQYPKEAWEQSIKHQRPATKQPAENSKKISKKKKSAHKETKSKIPSMKVKD